MVKMFWAIHGDLGMPATGSYGSAKMVKLI
jgi:hypothetical protein